MFWSAGGRIKLSKSFALSAQIITVIDFGATIKIKFLKYNKHTILSFSVHAGVGKNNDGLINIVFQYCISSLNKASVKNWLTYQTKHRD